MHVSVLLPVHNGMPYVQQAVESLLRQDFDSLEILALDDGSDDDTPRYLKSIGDSRLKYHRLARLRLVGALNFGLRTATGTYIARLDADDIAMPHRMTRQFQFLSGRPRCVAASSAFERIDLGNRPLGTHQALCGDAAIRFQMLFTTPFLHPGVMFRRDAAIQCGGYRSDYDVAEDYDLWTRLAAHGELANLPDILTRYRANPSGVSSTNRSRQVAQASEIASNYAPTYDSALESHQWRALHRLFTAGETPNGVSGTEMLRTFQIAANGAMIRQRGLTCRQDERELRDLVGEYSQKLSWRFSEQISAVRWNPITKASWGMGTWKLRNLSAQVASAGNLQEFKQGQR